MSTFPPYFFRREGPDYRRPAAKGKGSRRGFASSWWGMAWVHALEERARLDPNRLPRGRSYARSGAVGDLDVEAGEVRAKVQGSRRAPYDVVVRVRRFDESEWERLLDAVARQVGHIAALLDGELPPEVVDDATQAGLDLLPGAGEVGPRCSCPDWADLCKHAAAVCYLVADVLDRDPFALLLLRGRSRDEVLAGLRSRRSHRSPSGTDSSSAPTADEGVIARTAFERAPGPLPAVPLPPTRPGRPAVLAVDPPAASPIRREDLTALAADAAVRAWEFATGAGDGGLGLDEQSDLARRAAAVLGQAAFETLAGRAEVPSRQLAAQALAWRLGGGGGVRVLVDTWRPAADVMAEGRAALSVAGLPGTARVQHNRVSCADVQLRLGGDGLWYRLRKTRQGWELDSSGVPDPQSLCT
jgi:uncharacterized Zn finger protein